MITEKLKEAKLQIVNDGIKELWNPDEEAMDRCKEFGEGFVSKL